MTNKNNPYPSDLYKFGTIGKILQLLKLPDGTIKVLVEGIERAKVVEITENKEFISAKISPIVTKIKSILCRR